MLIIVTLTTPPLVLTTTTRVKQDRVESTCVSPSPYWSNKSHNKVSAANETFQLEQKETNRRQREIVLNMSTSPLRPLCSPHSFIEGLITTIME